MLLGQQLARKRDSDEETDNLPTIAVTAIFGKPSEYQKLQLSGAHGIASVTGLRLQQGNLDE